MSTNTTISRNVWLKKPNVNLTMAAVSTVPATSLYRRQNHPQLSSSTSANSVYTFKKHSTKLPKQLIGVILDLEFNKRNQKTPIDPIIHQPDQTMSSASSSQYATSSPVPSSTITANDSLFSVGVVLTTQDYNQPPIGLYEWFVYHPNLDAMDLADFWISGESPLLHQKTYVDDTLSLAEIMKNPIYSHTLAQIDEIFSGILAQIADYYGTSRCVFKIGGFCCVYDLEFLGGFLPRTFAILKGTNSHLGHQHTMDLSCARNMLMMLPSWEILKTIVPKYRSRHNALEDAIAGYHWLVHISSALSQLCSSFGYYNHYQFIPFETEISKTNLYSKLPYNKNKNTKTQSSTVSLLPQSGMGDNSLHPDLNTWGSSQTTTETISASAAVVQPIFEEYWNTEDEVHSSITTRSACLACSDCFAHPTHSACPDCPECPTCPACLGTFGNINRDAIDYAVMPHSHHQQHHPLLDINALAFYPSSS